MSFLVVITVMSAIPVISAMSVMSLWQSWQEVIFTHIFDISGNPMVMASASNSSPTKSFLCWFQFSLWCLSVILKSNYFLLQARWPLQMTYWMNFLFWSINKVVIIPNNSIHSAKSYRNSQTVVKSKIFWLFLLFAHCVIFDVGCDVSIQTKNL